MVDIPLDTSPGSAIDDIKHGGLGLSLKYDRLTIPHDFRVEAEGTSYRIKTNQGENKFGLLAGLSHATRVLMAENPERPDKDYEVMIEDAFKYARDHHLTPSEKDSVKNFLSKLRAELTSESPALFTGKNFQIHSDGHKAFRVEIKNVRAGDATAIGSIPQDVIDTFPDVMSSYPRLTNKALLAGMRDLSIEATVLLTGPTRTRATQQKRAAERLYDRTSAAQRMTKTIRKARETVDLDRARLGLPPAIAHIEPEEPKKQIAPPPPPVKKKVPKKDRKKPPEPSEEEQLAKTQARLEDANKKLRKLRRQIRTLPGTIREMEQRIEKLRVANTTLETRRTDESLKDEELAALRIGKHVEPAHEHQSFPDTTGIPLAKLRRHLNRVSEKIDLLKPKVEPLSRRHEEISRTEQQFFFRHAGLLETIDKKRAKPSGPAKPPIAKATAPREPEPPAFGKTFKKKDGSLWVRWKLAGKELTVPLPKTYKGIGEWVNTHLQGLVVLAAGTAKELENSHYADKEKAYRSLLLVATYVDKLRAGRDNAEQKQNFDDMLVASGLRYGPIGKAPRSGKYAADYIVTYDGTSYTMAHAIKGHDSRNHERCLRTYYKYDRKRRQAIIGRGFRHLSNALD
jgi:hypothetical protein